MWVMRQTLPIFTLVLAFALLTACAKSPVELENPGVSAGQQSVDQANCRSRAKRKAEKEYAAAEPMPSAGGFNTSAAFSSQISRYDASRRAQTLYEACLRRLGYRPAQAPE